MTQPITWKCYQKHDEPGSGYLIECEHPEHSLEYCWIAGCGGFIVNRETWNPAADFICEMCQDCGYHYDENGELVQPGEPTKTMGNS